MKNRKLNLTIQEIKNREHWEKRGYQVPDFDVEAVREMTRMEPVWLHFGAGNLFRAFLADVCSRLLDSGETDRGIIAADRRKREPDVNDDLYINVTLCADGAVKKSVIGSISERTFLYGGEVRIREIFEKPSLQMVSFTITEKGYALTGADGKYLPEVAEDLAFRPSCPEEAKSYMGKLTAMLYARYLKNRRPLAMVSMDNCSHNGDKLKTAVETYAGTWYDADFLTWLSASVSFPLTMIDKITPGPDAAVGAMLRTDGLPEGTPFVNAEETEYLVIEDRFPNGRPALEKAGVIFTDRETVNKAETMKVMTCLNPLHTALAVFGCLLGYSRIADEMKDEDLNRLVRAIGYREGLPAAVDPGVLDPGEFLDTVVNVRFPNPFLPDTPQRIATDTSQKMPFRFGETVKAYMRSDTLQVSDLHMIPLVYAAWLRYLMGTDDRHDAFVISPDPLAGVLCPVVRQLRPGDSPDRKEVERTISPILHDGKIFGVDLYEAGLANAVCEDLSGMLEGPGAVRKSLRRHLDQDVREA